MGPSARLGFPSHTCHWSLVPGIEILNSGLRMPHILLCEKAAPGDGVALDEGSCNCATTKHGQCLATGSACLPTHSALLSQEQAWP